MKYVPQAVSRAAGNVALRTQKNSPTLLFVAGVGGVVTATVLACRATLKARDVVDHAQKEMIDADILSTRGQTSELEHSSTRRQITISTSIKLSKLYAPSVGIGVISIACLTKSHRQLTQRNAALTAAYVSLQNFLESYRGRVRQEIGQEGEERVYYASTPVELVEDTKNGPKKVFGSAPTQHSPYSAAFDDTNLNWQDSAEYNIHFIRIQEGLLTDKLRAQGHLFLNDVYDRLGIKPTSTGQQCGWHVDHPESDDFVEIKILPVHDFQGTLMLDFNVAGVVMDMLDWKRS